MKVRLVGCRGDAVSVCILAVVYRLGLYGIQEDHLSCTVLDEDERS